MQTTSITTEKVSRIFFRYLFPSIGGTMVTSIYLLADTIIVGKGIGIDAITGLNIILPVFSLLFGTGLLYGVGGSVLMSIARGRGDLEEGERYYTASLFLTAITCVLYMVFFLSFMDPIVRFLGGTDVTTPYINDYIYYTFLGLACYSFSTMLQTFVRNDGAPKLSMIAVMSGGISNIFLDLLFVYVIPWGMAGASIASVIGTTLTVGILLTHFFSKKNGLHIRIAGIRLRHIWQIFQNGFTSFLIEMTSGIFMFVFNRQLLAYLGDVGVSIYSIISNTALVVNCLCNGVCQASQPIISTNYGAGLKDRILEVRRLGMKTALIICAIPTVLGLIVPNAFTYIFIHPTEEILRLAPDAIRIYFTGFLIVGLNMVIISYFQATTRSGYSLVLCLSRGCVLSCIFAYVLPLLVGAGGIWAAVPLAECLTLIAGVILLRKSTKEVHS